MILSSITVCIVLAILIFFLFIAYDIIVDIMTMKSLNINYDFNVLKQIIFIVIIIGTALFIVSLISCGQYLFIYS